MSAWHLVCLLPFLLFFKFLLFFCQLTLSNSLLYLGRKLSESEFPNQLYQQLKDSLAVGEPAFAMKKWLFSIAHVRTTTPPVLAAIGTDCA